MTTTVRLLVRSSSEGPQLSQLFTGFGILGQRGDIQLSAEAMRPYYSTPSRRVDLRAVVNDSTRLVYDVTDGSQIDEDGLAWCDAYFKRSYTSAEHAREKRIHPLGLNYGAYG